MDAAVAALLQLPGWDLQRKSRRKNDDWLVGAVLLLVAPIERPKPGVGNL